MADLLKLAERVEALQGPDREVDELIERAVGTYSAFSHYTLGDDDQPDYIPTSYTASLDATMTLVPEGWMLITLSDIAADGMPFARLGDCDKVEECGIAGNTTLALCAAALRARAANG